MQRARDANRSRHAAEKKDGKGNALTEVRVKVFCSNPKCSSAASWKTYNSDNTFSRTPFRVPLSGNALDKCTTVRLFPDGVLPPQHREKLHELNLELEE